ncbi:hypothetical protein ACLMJK_001982 [Lecanora helva]
MSGSQSQIPSPSSPALPPPPNVVPNFSEPYSLNPYQTLEIAACVSITTVMLAARVYTKVALLKHFTWEDYSALLAWASFIVFVGLLDSTGRHGAGVHQWNLHYQDAQYAWKFGNIADMVYSIALLATKLSIMLLILRVFCSVQRDIPYFLTIGLIAVNSAFYLCFLIIPTALCKPRRKIWTPELPGKCLDVNKLYLASAVFNFLSDIAMLSVPIYLVWRLQMSIRRKIGVTAIFCTGGLACISSILRLIYVVFLTHSKDYTHAHFAATMWSTAEIAFGLICSNVVVFPRLYRHFCDITPSAPTAGLQRALKAGTEDALEHEMKDGRTKREWLQLEERAAEDVKVFANRARLEDEEAFDVAVDEDRIKRP